MMRRRLAPRLELSAPTYGYSRPELGIIISHYFVLNLVDVGRAHARRRPRPGLARPQASTPISHVEINVRWRVLHRGGTFSFVSRWLSLFNGTINADLCTWLMEEDFVRGVICCFEDEDQLRPHPLWASLRELLDL